MDISSHINRHFSVKDKKVHYDFLKKTSIWLFILVFAFSAYSPRLNILNPSSTPNTYGWGFIHYFLGAKYYNEIDYFSFYECNTEAGVGNINWNENSAVRDLRSYKIISLSNLPTCNKSNFQEERWQEYKGDVDFAYKTERVWGAEKTLELITDKGFNATPFWSVSANAFLKIFPVWFLIDLDLLLLLASIALIWYFLGEKIAQITSLFVLLYFGTFLYLGGQFMQYIWFFFLVGSILLWHRERPSLSGIASGLSIGLYSFPIFFSIPFFIYVLRGPYKIKNNPYFKFTISCIATLLFCFTIGSMSTHGTKAWSTWFDKISIHSQYLKGEIFNMGLPVFSSTVFTKYERTYSSYEDVFPQTQEQLQTYYQIKYFVWFVALSLLVWWLRILWTTKEKSLFGYGYIPLYLLTALSPFYHLSIALLPIMFWDASKSVKRYIGWGIFALILLNIPYLLVNGYINFVYNQHLLSGIFMFIFVIGLMFTLHRSEDKNKTNP
ncbi:MAG: hypothetical protein WAW92_03015 [Minisyncoccia bacterium]